MEDGGQALHQAPEVHPAVGGEEEENLGALEVALHADQLHLQLVLQDFLLANPEGVLLLLPVFLHHRQVLLGGQANHRAKGGDQLGLLQPEIPTDAVGKLLPGSGLHNEAVPRPAGEALGIKIVLFPFAAKANTDNLCHSVLLYLQSGGKPAAQMARTDVEVAGPLNGGKTVQHR